ncbi:hypothetical protein GCM10009795_038840 [Nocardioides hankookensis]
MRALIYTRISRDATGDEAGVTRQREDCEYLARRNGWEVVRYESDNSISAYGKVRRPAWEAVIEAIKNREVDVVVCYHIDRMTRRPLDMEMFIELSETTGVQIATVTGKYDLSTDDGRMHARFMSAIARGEVDRKGARQKRANAQRRAAGKPWTSGWASFGYDLEKRVIPEQAAMIRKAADDVLAGASLKSIARAWRDSGITTPRSSKGADGWTHNGVKTILLNPVNAGILTYRGDEIGPGAWEPILSEDTLRQLQALLRQPDRRTNHSPGRTPQNLLSGIARCARCSSTVVAGSSNGKKVYKCSSSEGDHLSTLRDEADAFVLEALTAHEVFASRAILPASGGHADQDALMADLAELDRREATITERFGLGRINEQAWLRALESIGGERDSLEDQLARTQGEARTAAALAAARIQGFLALSLPAKRLTIKSIVEIELHPRERRRNVPIDKQVTIWARSEKRLSPLISGTNPNSVVRATELVDRRDAAKIEALGPDELDE